MPFWFWVDLASFLNLPIPLELKAKKTKKTPRTYTLLLLSPTICLFTSTTWRMRMQPSPPSSKYTLPGPHHPDPFRESSFRSSSVHASSFAEFGLLIEASEARPKSPKTQRPQKRQYVFGCRLVVWFWLHKEKAYNGSGRLEFDAFSLTIKSIRN